MSESIDDFLNDSVSQSTQGVPPSACKFTQQTLLYNAEVLCVPVHMTVELIPGQKEKVSVLFCCSCQVPVGKHEPETSGRTASAVAGRGPATSVAGRDPATSVAGRGPGRPPKLARVEPAVLPAAHPVKGAPANPAPSKTAVEPTRVVTLRKQ